jgi:adenine deaminase
MIVPEIVFHHGEQVVNRGKMTISSPSLNYPDFLYHTIILQKGKLARDFELRAEGKSARVWVIELIRDQIVNKRAQAQLQVADGVILPDVEKDILKLAVVERYGKNGGIGISFVNGFGLKRGAIASSVSHDHHNIVVAGINDSDMAICVNAIEETQGGLAIAANGKLIDCLPLPIGGLMSEKPGIEVIQMLGRMNQHYRDLGGVLSAPFMSLSFISLPTVPELGLTDKGLVDVHKHELISSIIKDI